MNVKFDLKKVILISAAYGVIEVMWFIYNSYVPIYLQAGHPAFSLAEVGAEVRGFGLGPAVTGFILTLDNILALIVGPYVGMLSDSSRSKRGRRTPFVLFSMPFMIVALAVVAFLPQLITAEQSGQYSEMPGLFAAYMAFLIILLTASAVINNPLRALLYDITPSDRYTTANAITGVVGTILLIAVVFGGAALFTVYQPLPFWIVAGLILIALLLVWLFIKEPAITGGPNPETETVSPGRIIETIRAQPAEANRSLFFLSLALLFAYIALSEVQAFFTSYAVSKLDLDVATASSMIGIFALGSAIVAMPAAYLANRFGRKRMMMIGLAILVLLCLTLTFVANLTLIIIAMLVFAVGWLFGNVCHAPMVVDHSPSDQFFATYISINIFVATLGLIIGPLLGGWVVEAFGNDYGLIWPLMAVFFALAFVALIPVTRGEAKKAVPA